MRFLMFLTFLSLFSSLTKPLRAEEWTPRKDWSGRDASRLMSTLPPREMQLAGFLFAWEANKLRIRHRDRPQDPIWESRTGRAFVLAGRGLDSITQWRGSFILSDRNDGIKCREQTVDAMRLIDGALEISGRLRGPACDTAYALRFTAVAAKRLQFQVRLPEDDGRINRLFLNFQSEPNEHFFGFGEQFTYLDLKGRTVPILSTEQGHLRGLQPYSFALNKISPGAAGNWATTYAALPYYMTDRMHSVFLENTEYSAFDLEDPAQVEIRVWSNQLSGQILAGSTPLELLETFTEFSGRLPILPRWFHSGAIVGLMGGGPFIREIWARLQAEKTPIAGFWVQDWEGKRNTPYGVRMWWNWEVDREAYPDWEQLVHDFSAAGIATLGYVNPFLSDVSSKPNAQRNLFAEAKAKGYLVQKADGTPYEIDSGGFTGTLVDLTNPEAFAWYKNVLVSQLIHSGMKGWMADFGEALPFDAVLHAGAAPTVHNQYPELWAKLNREAIQEAGMEGEVAAFLRSGSLRSSRYAPLYWLGDQMTTWDEHDGMKSAITGLLSGGLSGFSINHMDIGGLISMRRTVAGVPLLNFVRTKELLMRSAELSAFTAVYRNHEGNSPEVSHQFYTDDETLAFFAKFARVYALLADYREQLFIEAHERGYPIARSLFLHYPEDPESIRQNYQWLLGPDFLVAPVVDPGQTTRSVYFPKGEWVHVWSGQVYGQTDKGVTMTVPAPLGQPPVFYKKGSVHGARFQSDLMQLH